MFKLVVFAALLAFAAAKPTTLLTSPLATAPIGTPLSYAYSYGTPLAYTYPGAYAQYGYRTGLTQIGYDYAPLAYIN